MFQCILCFSSFEQNTRNNKLKLTFKKEERLSSRKLIAKLYESGKSFNSKCFRLTWMQFDGLEKFPAQILISVSKRNFKRAVDRNRIKRMIREAYRKNKFDTYNYLTTKNKKIVLALSYLEKQELAYADIENKIIVTLQRLQAELEKNT